MAAVTLLPVAAAGTFRLGDMTVNHMGFGAMRITGEGIWGEPKDVEACKRVLRCSAELGINLIDTAALYGPDVSTSTRAAASSRQQWNARAVQFLLLPKH